MDTSTILIVVAVVIAVVIGFTVCIDKCSGCVFSFLKSKKNKDGEQEND